MYPGNSDDRIEVCALLDTGACVNFVSKKVAVKMHVLRRSYDGEILCRQQMAVSG